MKTLFALLFVLLPYSSNATEYTDELCEDYQKIAKEFVDAELAGVRWQGVMEATACLKKQKPETMSIDRSPASDPAFLDPEYLLPEGRNITIAVKRLPNDLLDVVMSYIGRKNKKDIAVKDTFTLKLNYGKVRNLRGCASFYSEPQHFVMKERCWRN